MKTALLLAVSLASISDAPIDYSRQVKPILVARCFRCHSSLKQESGLRLDSVAAILKGGEGGPAVVPGKSGESLLIWAVRHQNDLRMPPEGERATDAEVAILRRWVDEGAKGPSGTGASEHWAFNAPTRPSVPTTEKNAAEDEARPENPIDAFLAVEHARRNLKPVAPAPKNVLLRRVYLDLIGLPPTPDELREFLADDSPEAYERVVDRLLASPRYGERWGRHWMDVWRYSDWDGYGSEIRESQPHIWRWRDWIVESLNADRGYNQMVAEMLAADELSPADPNALRATGFLARNWYKFNRNVWLDNTIEHTGKAFLGLTLNCSRCHDHMYDPLPQRDYYALRAFFEPHQVRIDSVPGQSDTAKDGLARVYDADAAAATYLFVRGDEKQPHKDEPLTPAWPAFLPAGPAIEPVSLPVEAYYPGFARFAQEEAVAAARAELATAEGALQAAQKALASARQTIEARPASDSPAAVSAELVRPFLEDDFSKAREDLWSVGEGAWEYKNGRLVQTATGAKFCRLVSQRSHPAALAATLRFKTLGGEMWKSVGLSFDAHGDEHQVGVYLSAVSSGAKLQVFERRNGQDSYPAAAAKPLSIEVGREYELSVSVRERLVNVWVDGVLQLAYTLPNERRAEGKFAIWTFDAAAEFIQARVSPLASEARLVERVEGSAAPEQVARPTAFDAIKRAEEAERLAQLSLIAARASLASVEARIAADRAQFSQPPAEDARELSRAAAEAEREFALRAAQKNLLAAEQKAAAARAALVEGDAKSKSALEAAEKQAAEVAKARSAAEAARQTPGESYTRFGPLYPAASTGRRAALARWIISDANPLTARVAVNHIWLRHFHAPLAPTVFDFGLNGKPPTHPELLDYLAVELMENGWRMKHLHRLIVTSGAYRLASASREAAAANRAIDPDNLWYWRANPRRMEAEAVRDATLHLSGGLDLRLGGPELDQNAALSAPRRSLYFRNSKEKKVTFLALFDNPNVVECYRRNETVAPQQALAMANSALSLEQARRLAGELNRAVQIEEDRLRDAEFIARAFERLLCRLPTADEAAECAAFLDEQAERLANLKSLSPFTSGAKSGVPPSADPRQRARENLVHVLLNHNEFVTVR